ncbi:MAG TPA: hypothetical protein VHU61_14570 [Solirubrobacteraceae bacterium]|nr:hypothetical protein [Solirubrobacteraceae bacterium]
MIAYKFLAGARRGRFSAFTWPEPGTWVRDPGPLDVCRSGIHACAVEHLPFWLDQELWVIELDGEVLSRGNQLVAGAGRLVERVSGWTPACTQDYADECARRGARHAMTALRAAGFGAAATRLEEAASVEDLRAAAAELVAADPELPIAVAMARDGARRAVTGAAPTAAYIAAHTAARVGGSQAYAAERRRQADWLAARLGL